MNIQNHNQLSCAKRSIKSFPIFNNVNKFIFTILFSLYLALLLFSYIKPSDFITIINVLLGLFALLLLSTRIRRKDAIIYIFVGFLAASFLASSLIVGRTGRWLYSPIIFIIYNFGIALILLRGYVYRWGGYIVFYGLVAYFLILMLTGVPPNEALFSGSTEVSNNTISLMMLAACISLYIILSMEKIKIDLKPALFTLVISIYGMGRSGIASSLVLLFGLIFVKFRTKRIFIVIILLIIVLVFYFLYAMQFSLVKNAIDHYATRSMQEGSPRLSFWKNYFNNLDISRVIFGVNVLEDPWPDGEINEYNYHNSFINLHLQTGFMGLITLALIIFSLFKFYKTNQVFFFLLLTLILRSLFDSFIFFGRFDFIPFFFIFYFLKGTHFRD